ncbi:sulfotransferase [Marinospirillum insulare]|uniref:AAA domain-containing protein n=1 Tax=Marinospirillum insulare TaxID=217169 RepID=A0ABQ6A4M8_9GAMM|nr:sulfotransferase [Marinospirillum insulare]GLR65069.1 hypothetical protein GCM10007878_25080 [Marinospirillum insulare]
MKQNLTLSQLKKTSPTFILGNQKSGTTAIAALLAQATDSSVALDNVKAILDSTC